MSTAVFLQVRLDSTRLPAKALYELSGQSIISHCMNALAELGAEKNYLLSDDMGVSVFESFAAQAGFSTFAGSKLDVLDRFVKAANLTGTRHILRATGDNPLVSVEASRLVYETYIRESADYCVMTGLPKGGCAEAVSASALNDVHRNSTDSFEHEHVCPGVYRKPERFKVVYLPAPPHLRGDDLSVSVDTIGDYLSMKALFDALYAGEPITLPSAIRYLRALHTAN